MIYWQLFCSFFKTGLFSIGGGLATLPFLYEISEKYGWFSEADIANMIAVAESTPGPIGVNMATYAGMITGGVPGAIVATTALVLPSVIIIILVVKLLQRFHENRYVLQTMQLLRPCSVGLIGAALLSVMKVALLHAEALALHDWDQVIVWPAVGLFLILLAVQWKVKKLHPIVLIFMGAAAGIVLQM